MIGSSSTHHRPCASATAVVSPSIAETVPSSTLGMGHQPASPGECHQLGERDHGEQRKIT
jgi:hypothetical protein